MEVIFGPHWENCRAPGHNEMMSCLVLLGGGWGPSRLVKVDRNDLGMGPMLDWQSIFLFFFRLLFLLTFSFFSLLGCATGSMAGDQPGCNIEILVTPAPRPWRTPSEYRDDDLLGSTAHLALWPLVMHGSRLLLSLC